MTQPTRPRRPKTRNRRRAKTISKKRLTRQEMLASAELAGEVIDRPENREECRHTERPCPYVSCRYHLYLDVNPDTGSIKLNFPDLEVWEMPYTCALDVAEEGGITLEKAGEILNLTRERIRQMEVAGLEKIRESELGGEILDSGLPEDRR